MGYVGACLSNVYEDTVIVDDKRHIKYEIEEVELGCYHEKEKKKDFCYCCDKFCSWSYYIPNFLFNVTWIDIQYHKNDYAW